MENIKNKDSVEIVKENYIDFSKYTVDQRTYCSLYDGMKAVHRRCLYTAYRSTPRHKVKLPNHVGACMVYHPHGDSSIAGAIIGMASRYRSAFPLYETKGNFGDRNNPASAPRYLEAMLSDLAIDLFMSFIDYADYGIPEFIEEPLALPSLLPLAFLHGSSGIGVGTPNPNIPAFNPVDLINYCVEALNDENFNVRDNFMVKPNVGNTNVISSRRQWLDMMKNGEGQIKYQANVEMINPNTIIITRVPDSKDFVYFTKKFDLEIMQDKIDIRDESDEEIKWVIEKVPRKSVDMQSIVERSLKYLTVPISYKFIFSDNGIAKYCTFNDVIRSTLQYTIKCATRKFINEIEKLSKQLQILQIIELIKKDNLVKKLSELNLKDTMILLSNKYKISEDIAKLVLQKPISYLTKEHYQEIIDLESRLEKLNFYKENPREYLKELYKDILPKVKKNISDKIMTEFRK